VVKKVAVSFYTRVKDAAGVKSFACIAVVQLRAHIPITTKKKSEAIVSHAEGAIRSHGVEEC
jgi:hypothetical protein